MPQSLSINQAGYDKDTEVYLKAGRFMFEAARMAQTDSEHAQKLLAVFNPPAAARLFVDMGCGTGELALHWAYQLPGSRFVCVTNNALQAEVASRRHFRIIGLLCDYHAVSLPSGAADVVYFVESLGYGDTKRLLAESRRLLRPGGILAVKDFLCVNHPAQNEAWGYTFRTPGFMAEILAAGFQSCEQIHIVSETEDYCRFWRESELSTLHPPETSTETDDTVVWRAVVPSLQ